MNFPNSAELLRHSQKEALYPKLVAQLAKDFVLANIDFELAHDIIPNDLKIILHEKIYFLIMEKFSDYLNLLYIIDVPERAIREIKVTDAVDVAERVSFLILQRELQKVWLKTKYS